MVRMDTTHHSSCRETVQAEMAKIPRILMGRNKQKRFLSLFVAIDQNGRQMRLPWTLQNTAPYAALEAGLTQD